MGQIQRVFPVLTNSHLLKTLTDFPKKNYIIVFYLIGPVLDLHLVRLTVVHKRASFFKKVKAFAWFSSLYPIFLPFFLNFYLFVAPLRKITSLHQTSIIGSVYWNCFTHNTRHKKLVFKLLILMICWSLRVQGSRVYPIATFHV